MVVGVIGVLDEVLVVVIVTVVVRMTVQGVRGGHNDCALSLFALSLLMHFEKE